MGKKKIKRHRESVGAAQPQQDSTYLLCCVTASDCREPDLPVQLKRAVCLNSIAVMVSQRKHVTGLGGGGSREGSEAAGALQIAYCQTSKKIIGFKVFFLFFLNKTSQTSSYNDSMKHLLINL